jgi:transketolase
MDLAQLPDDLRRKSTNTLRFLAIDAVEKAKSGHPGLPMGAAEMAFVLTSEFVRFDSKDVGWIGRDRFVFSPGHGSMLLYGLLHLFGYPLTLDDLKAFRQWGSKTPGHPEYRHTPGVETTTGPLGQGFATAVGMAIAQKHHEALFKTPEFNPFDGHIWGICSDGDLMEGVSAEAASLAGHLKLGNLNFLYDSNNITIDGSTDITFTEDVGKRFEAYGWHVLTIDGQDAKAVRTALNAAKAETERPSLIIAKTTIGWGSPGKAGSNKAHGAPLGPDEAAKTREALGWPKETFFVPPEVQELFTKIADEKRVFAAEWAKKLEAMKAKYPEKAKLWDALFAQPYPVPGLENELITAAGATQGQATRSIGGKVLTRAAQLVPGILGGSADLDESTMTHLKESSDIKPDDFSGRNIHWGIREHAMGAAANGLLLFGGCRPYTATFLTFSDYMRPSIRLAALSRIPTVFVFTHDSIFLGEDGPTHQSIEHVPSLRIIPHLDVWRPATARETALAWTSALNRQDGPTTLILTRQKLNEVAGVNGETPTTAEQAAAYIAHEPEGGPKAVVIATGSELAITVEAAKALPELKIRVVSMPCAEMFLRRSKAEQEKLLPKGMPVGAVEAAKTDYWRRFAGRDGLVIGIDEFGQSAPAEVLAEKFGFTAKAIAEKLGEWLK